MARARTLVAEMLLGAMAWLVLAAPAAAIKVTPSDEAPMDADLVAFRKRMVAAARARDVDAIRRCSAPTMRYAFIEEEGLAGFLARFAEPDTRMWRAVVDTLALGGRFRTPDEFAGPYVAEDFPGGLDGTAYAVILADGVNVHDGPAATAAVVATASYDVVEVLEGLGETWVRIKAPNGRAGYVHRSLIRSPLDYRFTVRRGRDRSWRLTRFEGGE